MMTQRSHAAGKLEQPLRLDLAGVFFLAVFVCLTNVMNLHSKTTSGACDSYTARVAKATHHIRMNLNRWYLKEDQ